MNKPFPEECNPFYHHYIDLVTETNSIDALENSGRNLLHTLRTLPDHKGKHAYAEGKWSINDLLQHMIDSEIVFLYRALRIARGDKTPLAGFEQDDYVIAAQADYKPLGELIKQFSQTRELTVSLFKGFDPNSETNSGIANGGEISLRALAFIISGHCQHHHTILKERYL